MVNKSEDGWGTEATKLLLLIAFALGVAVLFIFLFNLVLNPSYSELVGLQSSNRSLEFENKELHVLLDNSFPLNLIYFYDSIISLFLTMWIVLWFIKKLLNPKVISNTYSVIRNKRR